MIINGKEYDIPREIFDLYEKIYSGKIGDRVDTYNYSILVQDFDFVTQVIDIVEKKYNIDKCKGCNGKRPLDEKGYCIACRLKLES